MLCCIDWTSIGTVIAAVFTAATAGATLWLVLVAKRQLKDLNKTAGENFLQSLKKDFFTREARFILAMLENEQLKFKIGTHVDGKEESFAYFQIGDNLSPDLKKALAGVLIEGRNTISSYEMDDFLLQHLEDIGYLEDKKVLTLKDVDVLFGYYLETIYDDCEIKKYVDWARKDDSEIYEYLEKVYLKVKLYQTNKNK